MDDLGRGFDALSRRIAELERRVGNMVRLAKVKDPAAEPGRATVVFQDGSAEFLSAPLPWAETSAGAMKTHHPQTADQQVMVFSPTGDLADAFIMSALNWDSNARPSQSQDVTTLAQIGDATLEIGAGSFKVTVGGSSTTFSGSGMAVEGGQITHNGTTVDDTHTHEGVMPGAGTTGTPV
jgi:phage baseplate assembly protein gpV